MPDATKGTPMSFALLLCLVIAGVVILAAISD
jgi:hypothetical protein